jgi:hypothetical protein
MKPLLTLLACSLSALAVSAPAVAQSRLATLRFAQPMYLEQLWTYQHQVGTGKARFEAIFSVGVDAKDPEGGRMLVVSKPSLFSTAGLRELLGAGIKKDDPRILYTGDAPQRSATFTRIDVDGDGIDEVVLTGSGGAGGTSLLNVFKIAKGKIVQSFEDSSRFGFLAIDVDGDGKLEIANPGFDFVADRNHVLQPKRFKIYRLKDDRYVYLKTLSREKLSLLASRYVERGGVPPPSRPGKVPVLRVFESLKTWKAERWGDELRNPFSRAGSLEKPLTPRNSIDKTTSAKDRYSSVPVVTDSARGWTLKIVQPGPKVDPRTIIVSPTDVRFDAGNIGVPDFHRPVLWVIDVAPLKAKFLVIYLYPCASGPSVLSLYLLKNNRVVCKSARILHHFEWDRETVPTRLVESLFKDVNADGRPELVENDVGKFGGTITYREFDGKRFHPRWKDDYKLDENDKLRRVKRTVIGAKLPD